MPSKEQLGKLKVIVSGQDMSEVIEKQLQDIRRIEEEKV